MDWFMKIFIGGTVLLLAGLFYAIYDESQQPAFSLVKADWKCTANHKQLYFIPVGKVTVPQWRDVCDKWERAL